MFCLFLVTIIEGFTTTQILSAFGCSEDAPRVVSMLVVFSCGTPCWCYANAYMWHTLWTTQAQLAAEKESSKSLLSMVCDATFWLACDGDTILESSRHFDALLGCRAERTRLSRHIPEKETSRLHSALSSQGLMSL